MVDRAVSLEELNEFQPAEQVVPEDRVVSAEELDTFQVPSAPEETDFADDILRQVGLTGRAVAEGGAGLVGIVADPIAVPVRSLINLFREDKLPLESFQTVVGDLLTQAGVPEPENKTEEIVQVVSQALVGGGGVPAIARGVAQRAAAPVTRAVSGVLAAQPGAQIVGAGTGQLAAEVAEEAGAGPVGQIAASLVGGVAGAGGVTRLAGARATPAIAGDVAAAEERGIRVLTSDVKAPDTFAAKWLQSSGEKIPVAGTGPVRVAQQEERVQAIKDTLREFGAEDTAALTDDVMRDLLKTRRKEITKHTQAKKEVFAEVKDAGIVPVQRTIDTIDAEIGKLTRLGTDELKPAIEKLTDWRNAIQGQGIDNIETLRKQLGASFSASDLTTIKNTSKESLSNIYGAIRDDIGDFIIQNGTPADHKKWLNANNKLSGLIGELDASALKSALNKGDVTPEVVRSLLFSRKPSDVRTLFKNLSPKGKSHARAAILSEAAEKSITGDKVSPQKFVTQINKLQNQFGVFFKGDDLKSIKGLERALRLTERAGVAGISPPTGQQLAIPVGAAILTDLLGGAGAALAAGGTLGGLARIYESKPVRNALIALSGTKSGGKEEAAIFKRLIAAGLTQQRNE
jgi:hypothetical protein